MSSRSLKESFSGNSVKISDFRAFSPFKTLPGCRAFRQRFENESNDVRHIPNGYTARAHLIMLS